MEQGKFMAFGKSCSLLMQEFHEVETSDVATPGEKEAVKLGIIAGIKLQEYISRKKNLPFGFSEFSEGIDSFDEICEAWNDFRNACNVCNNNRTRMLCK